jgi:hypothetical protein
VKTLVTILSLAIAASLTAAPNVRPAPDFTFPGIGGAKSLRTLRGQPVVLLVAKNAESRAFRKQVQAIEETYRELASRKTVFAVAFEEGPGAVSSNVPFVVVNNGAAVAKAYGLKGDLVVGVVSPEGNLDLVSGEVTRGLRIREVILNTYSVQNAARREQPKGPPPISQ